nr:uncharacterized protein LOC129383254 [Dermacentor andersoni]
MEISSMTTPETEDTETTETTETTELDVTETTETYGYTEKPKYVRGPLLCTVSVHFTETSLLPEDGDCEIIFYESFYVKNRPSDWQDSGLDHFLKLGRTMYQTSVGASFSPV